VPGGGSGGSVKTRLVGTLMYDLTLGSSGAFDTDTADDNGNTGIDSGFDWLEVVVEDLASTVSAASDFAYLLFNNDTTVSNYRRQALEAVNGVSSFGAADDAIIAYVCGATALANNLSSLRIFIPSYESSLHKHAASLALARTGATAQELSQWGVWWENTAAITRLMLRTDNHATDVFASGARLRIYGWKEESIGGLTARYSTDNVSNPPTDAQLDTAFGTPASVGSGFVGIVNDNNAGTDEYLCWSDGTNWFYATGVKAV
jgi:hypothetical protein